MSLQQSLLIQLSEIKKIKMTYRNPLSWLKKAKKATQQIRDMGGEIMADTIHCVRKTLRLMPDEAKALAKNAKDNGMNEAEYLRFLISQKPKDYPEVRKMTKELINEVNRIGININQIVFNNNSGLYSKDDKTQLIAYMRKLNQKIDEAVRQIGNQ